MLPFVPSLLGISLFTCAANAVASSPAQDAAPLQERAGYFAVKGIAGPVIPRLEISQLYTNQPDQWNVFLLGLQNFQAQAQNGKFSYYQLAGIHGVPNVPWDGVNANPAAQGGVGYCTHSSVLFPSWHRPYLALVEQFLSQSVIAAAQQFSGSQGATYVQAAQQFRLPFWDWAAQPPSGNPTLPLFFSSKYATVTTPTGQQTIVNPLFRYSFHPLVPSAMLFQPWSEWSVTLRWPSNDGSSGDPQAISRNNLAQSAIENARPSLADSLYNMFTLCSDYLEFSNDAASSSTPGCSTSLESIHNEIHSLTGGPNDGHMAWLWWSAFDPIFFMHHANVDRLFAMWQAIYPNNYGASQNATMATFTIPVNSTQDADSPLTPFHRDTAGHFYTTNIVRNHTRFGYTYPEFADSDGSTSAIMGYVNALYGPNATATAGSSKRDVTTQLVNPSTGNKFEYIANVAYQRYGLNGSYTIYLFMGTPSEDSPSDYPFDSNLIGTVSAFAIPGMTSNTLLSTGAVPLTRALTGQVQDGHLGSLERILVIPFLTEALQWRVVTSTGQLIPNSAVPGLEVSVVTSEYTPPANSNSFPTYQPFVYLPDVTNGKDGGLKSTEQALCEVA